MHTYKAIITVYAFLALCVLCVAWPTGRMSNGLRSWLRARLMRLSAPAHTHIHPHAWSIFVCIGVLPAIAFVGLSAVGLLQINSRTFLTHTLR